MADVGTRDPAADAPAHTPGINQGNSRATTRSRRATCPTARRPPSARPASTPKARDPIDPADAEPLAGLGAMARSDGRSRRSRAWRSPSRTPAPLEHAAVPTLRFGLRIESVGGRADPLGAARRPDPDRRAAAPLRRRAQDRLFELFGARSAGGHDAAHAAVDARRRSSSRRSAGATVVDLPVPCTYDLEVAASRYLDALGDGEVPLEFLFSGTVFYAGEDGPAPDRADRLGARRRSTGCRSRCGGDDGPPLPRHGLAAARRERASTGCAPTSRAAPCPPGTTRSTRCSPEGGWRGPGPRRSPTPSSTRATCSGPTAGRR